ncbi:MAG: hypothetical protein WBE80_02365 [Methylocella sp.]
MNALSTSTISYEPMLGSWLADFSVPPSHRGMPERGAALFLATSSVGSSLKEKFEKLTGQWRHNTAFSSSVTEIVLDPSYQQIIGMGVAVVPLILQELQNEPDHWYWALAAITGANPAEHVPDGDIQAACDAWLDWGKRRSIVR